MLKKLRDMPIFLGALLISGCAVGPPTSMRPAYFSSATAQPLWPATYWEGVPAKQQADAIAASVKARPLVHPLPNPAPFEDTKVVCFMPSARVCRDTFQVPNLGKVNGVLGPGVVVFSPTGLAADEVEITNVEWRFFVASLFRADSIAAETLACLQPAVAALPVPDYYTSPFYAYYPVVGISYEQALQFCKWRSETVNAELARSGDKKVAGVTCEYRLPTEAEWEEAALVQGGQPYGTKCIQLPVEVAEGAALYLRKRANTSVSVAQIKADIADYNKTKPIRSWINYAQQEPYFLRLVTPSYVYQGPPNDFGLYNLLGNVAEMVQEKGVTKGGSYRDTLEACCIKARGHYAGPAATVGFRTVCVMRYAK